MGTRIMNTILLLLFVPIGLLFAQDAKADPLQDYFANAIAVAQESLDQQKDQTHPCLLYTSPSPRD